MTETFHIGTLAARTGRSVHTIRWYEAKGLIPGVVRDGGGRRVYGPQHVQWLRLMSRLRLTGMSVSEMRDYAGLARRGRSSLAQCQALLQAHRARVEARLAEQRAALKLVDAKIRFYDTWIKTGVRPTEPRVPSKA